MFCIVSINMHGDLWIWMLKSSRESGRDQREQPRSELTPSELVNFLCVCWPASHYHRHGRPEEGIRTNDKLY